MTLRCVINTETPTKRWPCYTTGLSAVTELGAALQCLLALSRLRATQANVGRARPIAVQLHSPPQPSATAATANMEEAALLFETVMSVLKVFSEFPLRFSSEAENASLWRAETRFLRSSVAG